MQNTRNLRRLGGALIELIGFLNSPQRDDALLREADVEIDRALFPILVALGARNSLGVAEIADLVGRDHTTVSRQLAKLAALRLVARAKRPDDRRRSATHLTPGGKRVVYAITAARLRLLSRALRDWGESDVARLAELSQRFARSLQTLARSLT